MSEDLVHAVLEGLNEKQSKGGLVIRKKKTDAEPRYTGDRRPVRIKRLINY